MIFILAFILATINLNNAFKLSYFNKRITKLGSTTWQEDLDQILDVDTSCDSRREMTRNILRLIYIIKCLNLSVFSKYTFLQAKKPF
jgi:hypothetical protein